MASQSTSYQMLQAFENCLKKQYSDQDQTEIGRRAVTVIFEKSYYPEDHDGKILSIDAVPAFESGDDEYEIPDKVTGTWIKTNPKKAQGTGNCKEQRNGCLLGSTGENGQRMESSQWQTDQAVISDRSYGRRRSWRAPFSIIQMQYVISSAQWKQISTNHGQIPRD